MMASTSQDPGQHIEVDDDLDSSLGDDDQQTTTTSLASSIYAFRQEHGRTYHAYKDGSYNFPNDERESDRLDLQHHLCNITFDGKLTYAPFTGQPKHVLDVGTGTGIWALDFADMYPESQVIGTDLSPSQPSFVPPNLRFIIDDAEDEWLYDQKFDLIHFRMMNGSFKNLEFVVQSAFENLAPGGWLDIQDFSMPTSNDGTYDGSNLEYWVNNMVEASKKLGRSLDQAKNYRKAMEKAGFVDIEEQRTLWPLNTWPKDPKLKEVGKWNNVNISEGLEAFSLAMLSRGLGWSKEEIEVLIAKVRPDLKNRAIHSYYPIHILYGRKP